MVENIGTIFGCMKHDVEPFVFNFPILVRVEIDVFLIPVLQAAMLLKI